MSHVAVTLSQAGNMGDLKRRSLPAVTTSWWWVGFLLVVTSTWTTSHSKPLEPLDGTTGTVLEVDSAEADLASPLKVDGGGLDVGPLLPKVLASLPINNQSSIDDKKEAQIRINLDSARVTKSSVELVWTLQGDSSGEEREYQVKYRVDGDLEWVTAGSLKVSSHKVTYKLSDLQPYTEYSITVETTSEDGVIAHGEISVRTDVNQPGAPSLTALKCQDVSDPADSSISIQWTKPSDFYHSVDSYKIFWRRTDTGGTFKNITVRANRNSNEEEFTLTGLTSNASYEVKVCAETESLTSPDENGRSYTGEPSNKLDINLPAHSCSQEPEPGLWPSHQGAELSAGMIGGAVCAILFLLLAIIGFVVWRRYFKAAYYYLDEPGGRGGSGGNQGGSSGIPNWENEPGPAFGPLVGNGGGVGNGPVLSCNKLKGGGSSKGPIHVDDFLHHVTASHADSDAGFSREYSEIQRHSDKVGRTTTHDHSSHPDNKSKNRYLNIVAYDHTRVKLAPLVGQKKTSDYINANFIDGFRKCNAYIATQGPLEDTRDAFWRMVWEQNVYVIVMITNLMERGRRKCDIYWPRDETPETYGQISAQLEKEETMADFTIRTIKIKHTKLKRKKGSPTERVVRQFHYTSWPDHGVPCHPLPVLTFVRKSVRANILNDGESGNGGVQGGETGPGGAQGGPGAVSCQIEGGGGKEAGNEKDGGSPEVTGGPIIVHCSAGVGRTGTYISIDTMLKQSAANGEFNVFGFLKHIRGQRNHLVQTEEQYVFIHDAIVEAIRSGNTEICKEELSGYVEGLTQPIPVKTRQSGSKSDKKVAAGDEDHDEGGGDKDGGADKSGTTSGDLMLMVDPGDPAIEDNPSSSLGDQPPPVPLSEPPPLDDPQHREEIEMTEKSSGGGEALGTSPTDACQSTTNEQQLNNESTSENESTQKQQPSLVHSGSSEEEGSQPPSTTTTLLDEQFKMITEFTPSPYQYLSAEKEFNVCKNRTSKLVPVEGHRIPLAPKPGVEGSDYINASWLNGHSKLREFIVTQHPLESHKEDFWRMLWDHNAQTVVLLSKVDHTLFPMFWPSSASNSSSVPPAPLGSSSSTCGGGGGSEVNIELDCESFRVRFVEETVHQGHSTLDFVVSSAHDDYELAVRIIHCPEWRQSLNTSQPHHPVNCTQNNLPSVEGGRSSAGAGDLEDTFGTTLSGEAVDVDAALASSPDQPVQSGVDANLAVLKVVQDWHLEYQDGPLVVVDRYGGTEAATFCALTTLCKQLESSQSLDVYQVAKLYHLHRPGVWASKEDILYLYKAMSTLVSDPGHVNPLDSSNYPAASAEVPASSAPGKGCLIETASPPPPVGNSVIPNIPPPSYSAVSQEGDGSDVIERRHSASMASSSNGINADNLQNSSAGGGSNSGSRRHSLPGLTPDGSNVGGPPSQNQTQTTDGDFKSLPTNTAASNGGCMTSNGGIGASKTLIPTSVAAAAPSKNDTNHHQVNGGSLGGVNGNNGFALPLNGGSIQDDPFEEYEDDLSETAALTQTTIS